MKSRYNPQHRARGLVLVALLGVVSCGMRGGDRVARYKEVSRQVKEEPATALVSLKKMVREEAGNALPHYLLAAAYANVGHWEDTLKEIEVGNAAPTCAYPVGEDTIYRNFLGFTALSQMVNAADAPTGLGLDAHKRLLVALRSMGEHIAIGEPCSLVTAQTGAWIRHHASHSMTKVWEQSGQMAQAEQARKVTVADKTWLAAIKQVSDEITGTGGALDGPMLLQKYHFTPEDAQAYDTGQTPSPSAREKMRQLSEEWDRTEQRLTKGLLKQMPR